VEYTLTFEGQRRPEQGTLRFGDLQLIPLDEEERAQIELRPAKHVDVGEGKGSPTTRSVKGGVVGLLLDGRGRPLQLPSDSRARVAALTKWHQAVNLYPTFAGSPAGS
jgi:hypothetical protein